jgi:hypothetical protein
MMPDVEIIKHDRAHCGACDGAPAVGRYAFASTSTKRGRTTVSLYSACDVCADRDMAHAEAESEGWRFTEIGVGVRGDERTYYNGHRCHCGAVTLAIPGSCVRCWRDSRMLDKAAAQSRMISRLLKELRSEIKGKLGHVSQPA